MLPCQKHLFRLPAGLHYLNCAYMSPLARGVEAAGLEGLRRKRDPSSIPPAMFFEESDEARRLFGRLVGVPADSVALIPAASYGLATAARNLAVSRGQNLVIMHEQFPSNVYTWRRLAEESGAELRTVGPSTSATSWDEQILDAVDESTALVTMSAVHWADGNCSTSRPSRPVRGRQAPPSLWMPRSLPEPWTWMPARWAWTPWYAPPTSG